eukprot:symbB.v1.2.029403.t1/scaffold3212.1/size61073/1
MDPSGSDDDLDLLQGTDDQDDKFSGLSTLDEPLVDNYDGHAESPTLDGIIDGLPFSLNRGDEVRLAEGASIAVGKAPPSKPSRFTSSQVEHEEHGSVPSSSSVVDAWMRLNRSAGPSLPWESGVFANPFDLRLKRPKLMPPVFGMQASLTAPVDEQTGYGQSTSTASHSFDFSKRRLRIAWLIQTEDHARFEALRKIKVLVLINPSTSELGRTLIAGAALLRSDQQLGSSIIDSFASKATGTLVKRAGALWRFARFCASIGIHDPLAADEATMYQYMQYLKVNGAATTANDFLQSWRFLHHAIGLKSRPIDEVSSRVKGAADGMFATKRKLVQAAPLTTMMVLALEKIVLNGPYIHWRLIAGHLLLCLGSCSRFADSIRLDNIVIDEHEGTYLIEAAEASYKTATTRERKARLLPILCLGRFFAHEPWAPVWMRLRAEAHFGNDPSLDSYVCPSSMLYPCGLPEGDRVSTMHADKVVRLKCLLNGLGCINAEYVVPCIEMTKEQGDLSEAEELEETSWTEGCGVHQSLRVSSNHKPLEHRRL